MRDLMTFDFEKKFYKLCLKAFPVEFPENIELINEYDLSYWTDKETSVAFKNKMKGKKWTALSHLEEPLLLKTPLISLFTNQGIVYFFPYYLNLFYRTTCIEQRSENGLDSGWFMDLLELETIPDELLNLFLKFSSLQARCVALALAQYYAFSYKTAGSMRSFSSTFWQELGHD